MMAGAFPEVATTFDDAVPGDISFAGSLLAVSVSGRREHATKKSTASAKSASQPENDGTETFVMASLSASSKRSGATDRALSYRFIALGEARRVVERRIRATRTTRIGRSSYTAAS